MIVWPNVVTKLLALLPTLSGWSGVAIYDGPPIGQFDPDDYALVGHATEDNGGTFTQERDDDGYTVRESGTVRIEVVCQSGDTDLATVRSRAFGLVDALSKAIGSDRTLGGVLGVCGTAQLAAEIVPVQAEAGSAQSLICAVEYQADTYPNS